MKLSKNILRGKKEQKSGDSEFPHISECSKGTAHSELQKQENKKYLSNGQIHNPKITPYTDKILLNAPEITRKRTTV